MKNYSYKVSPVGLWDAVVLNEDGEPVTEVMSFDDACELQWNLLSQDDRDEITMECELANELAAEDRANRQLSYTV